MPFQLFHTFGLVPRMSATVRRYSADSLRSFCTLAANAAITSGSDRSCFWAVDDMKRWFATSHSTISPSSSRMPCSRQKRRASLAPSVE